MNQPENENNPAVNEVPRELPKRLDPEDAQKALDKIEHTFKNKDRAREKAEEKFGTISDEFEQEIEDKYNKKLLRVVQDLHPSDIAFILGSLQSSQRHQIWPLVKPEFEGEVLLEVDDWLREELIASMNSAELVDAMKVLETDEIADLVPDTPPEILAELQKVLTEEERNQLLAALGYPEGTVGAIMDFDMLRLREDVTLEVVFRYLRRLEKLPEHTDKLFVVDRQDVLSGTLSLSTMLVSDPGKLVGDVMDTNYLCLAADDEDTEAASAFERYDLISAPVIDDQSRLIGRVTIDDILDVIREDSQEQDLSRAGLQEEDVFLPISKAIKNRAPWLFINLATAAVASYTASLFEDTVSQIVILAFLMSIVAGIGGNSGNQTMTMVIRALAVGRVTANNAVSLLKREFLVTFLVGICGSIVAAAFAWYRSKDFGIALVMVAAMILNMLIGATLGILIPVIRDRFNKDPALGSSVMLTFATDTLGFFIFLGLATIFLL